MDAGAEETTDFENQTVNTRVQFDIGRIQTSSADSNGREALVYPTLFVSHGTPALVLQADDPTHIFLRRLGGILPKPQYVIAVSAHWECNIATVTASSQPAIVHDYVGFPQSLYELHYQLRGCPSLAADICHALLEVTWSRCLELVFRHSHPGALCRREFLQQPTRTRDSTMACGSR
jgi:hypothetical protein